MEIKVDDLAELLVGVARAQKAVISGLIQNDLELERRIVQSLQGYAGVTRRPQPPTTLSSLPTQILLQNVGQLTPDREKRLRDWIVQELNKLLAPNPEPADS